MFFGKPLNFVNHSHIFFYDSFQFIAKFLIRNIKNLNMNNLISHDFLQAMQILGTIIGLYAIIFGVLLGIDHPKLKKRKVK